MCANDPYTSSCKRKAPLLSVCLCFTPLEAERCASVASSPSLWPGGAPLSPGRSVFMPLASSNPPRQCMEPAPTQRPNGRAAERQNLRLSRHPVTSLAANARFRQPTLLNQDWHAPPHAASSVGQLAIRRDERPADGRRGLPSRRRVFAGRVDLSYVNPGLTANANLCAAKTPVWQSRPDLAVRSEAATKRELGLRLADPREGA